MKDRFPRWCVGVFFTLFLLLGLVTAGDYGPTWDEMDEMDILRMNLWEYGRAFGLDEGSFEARASMEDRLTISVLTPISESIEQDHGVAAFYPLADVVMSDSLTEGQRSVLWHMGCWGVFALGAFALYAVCRELGLSRGWALMGPIMLLLSPRFFAQGHFNNKDIALMSLTLCALWQGLALMKRPTFPRGLAFALFGALAANAKVAGFALWGLCALFVLIRQLTRKSMTGRLWAVAGVTATAFMAFYVALTPALWSDPTSFFVYLLKNALSFQRWQNSVLFRGAVFDLTLQRLPWYYLPYMILATTPLWALLLIGMGTAGATVYAARRPRTDEGLSLLLCVLLWIVPIVFAVLTRTSVYNGWRHFYFVYGPMLAVAVWGLNRLWRLTHRRWARRALAGLLSLCMLFSAVGIVTQHPYQYAYYQPLVRLRGTDFNELDYWNISARDALCELAEAEDGELSVAPADLWTRDALEKALVVLPEELRNRFSVYPPERAEEARFVLVNPTYLNFSHAVTSPSRTRVTIRSYGQCIFYIYENPGKGVSAE